MKGAWNNKGVALKELGKYKEALGCYDKALSIDPGLVGAWLNKGAVFGKLGNYKEALGCYDKAVGINPKNVHAWFNKGVALINLGRKPEETIGCFEQVIERASPRDSALVEQAKRLIIELETQNT